MNQINAVYNIKKLILFDIIALSIACFILSLTGGHPYSHPDSNVTIEMIFRAIKNKGFLNFYDWPSFILYLHATLYYCIYLAMKLLNSLNTFQEFEQLRYLGTLIDKPSAISFYLPGHFITIVFSIIGVLSTYGLTYIISKKRTIAILASLFLLTSIGWIAHSHYMTTDIPLAALCITTVFISLYYADKNKIYKVLQLIVLGTLLGLSTGAKYNGALIVLPIILPMFCIYKKRLFLLFRDLSVIAFTSLLVFFITNPYTLIHFNQFREVSKAISYHHMVEGHFGYRTSNSALYHLRYSIPYSFGYTTCILSILGAFYLTITKNISIKQKSVLLITPIALFLFTVKFKSCFIRYILPIIPFLAIYASMCIWGAWELTNKAYKQIKHIITILILIICFICIGMNLTLTAKHNLLLTKTDTRNYLELILKKSNIKNPLSVFSGPYTNDAISKAKLPKKEHKIEGFFPYNIGSFDLIILDTFSFDRVIHDPFIKLHKPYSGFTNLHLIQLSPFKINKQKIGYSQTSVYSPYLPDLKYRFLSGPYIEIYCKDKKVAEKISSACQSNNISYKLTEGKDGYFFNGANQKYLKDKSEKK